jgi:hypothetical protein
VNYEPASRSRRQRQCGGDLLDPDHGPQGVTSAVHDRMPGILDPGGYDLWLDTGMRDAGEASEMLRPCDARMMRRYPVSTRINRVANDDAECSAPVELAQIQDRLFS